MTTIRVDNITNATGTGAPNFPDGITIAGASLASANTLDYYEQSTAPTTPKDSALWYDTTESKLKIYVGDTWKTIKSQVYIPPPPFTGDRGVVAGGNLGGSGSTGSNSNVIDYFSVPTAANAIDFGDLIAVKGFHAGCSNGSRSVFGGGTGPTNWLSTNTIDYITFATIGNATSFGTLTDSRDNLGACSDGSRGVFGGGKSTGSIRNIIDYVTIATAGNAIDFGDLTVSRSGLASCASTTRGLFMGGDNNSGTNYNVIDYITIATTGNAIDFGDLPSTYTRIAAASNGTTGIITTGFNSYMLVTIATLGNATFGANHTVNAEGRTVCANINRAVFAGGASSNVLDYVTFASLGNAVDFGDLTVARKFSAATTGN